jgi:ABC-2 type transport system permease protein
MFFTGIFIGPMYALIDDALADFAANLPDVLMAMVGQADMATPEGWLQTEVFSIMAPAAAVVVTVTLGAKGIAGEEQRHTMGLLLASPVRRSRVVLEKSLTMIVYAIGVGVATFAGTWVGSLIGGLGVSPAGITAATVLCTLLGLAFGGLALVLGAATGRSSVAASTAAGVAIVAYIADSFLSVNEATEAWAVLSPFHYLLSSDPLNNGMDWGHASVLTALFVVLVALSIPLFQARDLRG